MTIFTGGISSSVAAGRAVLDNTALFNTKLLWKQTGKQIKLGQEITILIVLGSELCHSYDNQQLVQSSF